MSSPVPISKWADALSKLYSVPDSARSPEEIWIASMAHCASIGEAIRKSDYVELMEFAARAFCWMVCLSVKFNKTDDLLFRCENTFCQCVYFKFPDCCGHCTEKTCQCRPLEMDAQKDKAGKYGTLLDYWRLHNSGSNKVDYTTADWMGLFGRIYSGRIHMQTFETLGFHFLEEAGEEASAIRELIQLRGVLDETDVGIGAEDLRKLVSIPEVAQEYIRLGKMNPRGGGKPQYDPLSRKRDDIYARIVAGKMNFIVELADTFSFFCSILIKLSRVKIAWDQEKKEPTYMAADLEEALQSTYGDPAKGLTCPTCKASSCKCVFFPRKELASGGTK